MKELSDIFWHIVVPMVIVLYPVARIVVGTSLVDSKAGPNFYICIIMGIFFLCLSYRQYVMWHP